MLSYFRSHFNTIAMVSVLMCTTIYDSPCVMAQFINCIPDTTDGTTICFWAESPLVLTESTTGTLIAITNSVLVTECLSNALFDVSSCVCAIIVQTDPNADLVDSDFCNSCTLLSVSEISYQIHFDCSNRAVGDCPIYNANGCQTSAATPTTGAVSPVSSPPIAATTPAPVPPPTATVTAPVPVVAVAAPTNIVQPPSGAVTRSPTTTSNESPIAGNGTTSGRSTSHGMMKYHHYCIVGMIGTTTMLLFSVGI